MAKVPGFILMPKRFLMLGIASPFMLKVDVMAAELFYLSLGLTSSSIKLDGDGGNAFE